MSKTKTVVYKQEDLVAYTPVPNLNLPDIVAEECFRPKDGSRHFFIHCKPTKKYDGPCPHCGCVGTNYHSKGYTPKPRLVHDVSVGIDRVDLILKVPRYICQDCGGVFSHSFESVNEGKQCTIRLLEKIQRDCFSRPFSDIAYETGYTLPTIADIFGKLSDELDATRPPIIAPEVLSLDEKHIVHSMRAVFVDNKTGRLLEMTEDNKRDTIIRVIESMVDYDKNIRIVTTDMANGYKSAIQECLPYAKIVVDKFHVFQLLHRKMRKPKSVIMADIKKQIEDAPTLEESNRLREVRDLINQHPFLFKFGRKKLAEKPERLKILADACQTFPELNHLRLIKEGFERIYDSQSRKEAEAMYEEWVKLIPPGNQKKVPEWEATYGVRASIFATDIASFGRVMKSWHKEIFAYFDPDCQVTNAVAEGTNCLIQRLNAQGNGYGFKHLRAKAIYWQDANTRTVYKLHSKKEPIYKPASSDSTPSFTFTYTPLGRNPNMRIVGYKETSEIVSETEALKRKPLSVLSFIDRSADFYDFGEDI